MLGLLPDDVGLLVNVSDVRLSPDARRVAFTVQRVDMEHNRYRTQVCVAPVDGGSPPVAVSPEPVAAGMARWSPDGTQLAYTARDLDDDDAVAELWVQPAEGGEPRVVCRCPDAPHELEWSPDGTRLAFVARDPDRDRYGMPGEHRKERDMSPRRIDRLYARLDNTGWISDRPSRVFVVAADGSGDPVSLTPGAFEASGMSWSPDSTRVAFASARHDTWDLDWYIDLFVANADGSGEPQRLTATDAEHSLASFDPTGRLACFRAPDPMNGPWHPQVARVPRDGGAPVVLTAALDRNCAPYPAARGPVWSGDDLYFLAEDGGRTHVYRVASDGTSDPQLAVGGDRVVTSLDVVGDVIAITAMCPSSLAEVFVVDASGERRLTDFTMELINHDRRIGRSKRFTTTVDGGFELDCWIIEPEHAPGTRVPLVLNIHGGPFTQYGDRFFDEFQFEVGAGFGVLFCNPRGSSGGTEAWGRAVRWPECDIDPGTGWGGVDYDDIMACLDEACRRFDWIDTERVAVMGGSYGGYMTSWIIGHTDRFAAAISERSCNNLLTLEHGSDVAGSFRTYVGVNHVDDPEPYLRHSPMRFVEQMHTPLLILHSEQDLRCPVNQAEELFVALRMLGRTPEFVRFPGESHELSRSGAPRHRAQRAEIILDFLRRHLCT